MRTLLRGAACAALTSGIVLAGAAGAEAAEPGQLCRTNSDAIIYTSPTTGAWVPQGALVRILEYRGIYYYARYAGTAGLLERQEIDQASCYFQ